MLRSGLHKNERFRSLLYLIGCAMFFFAAPPHAAAQFKAWVMAKLPDTPEGLGVDSHGNLYATLMHIGEVVMLKDDGSYDHIAWVPSKEESGKGDLIGLDLDQSGNIYVAYTGHSKRDFRKDLGDPFHPGCRDATVTQSGVYKIDAQTRKVTPLATKADGWPFCYPDDVAIDSSGNVYMTDLTYSGIWKSLPMGQRSTCGRHTLCSIGLPSRIRGSLWALTISCSISNRKTSTPSPTATP